MKKYFAIFCLTGISLLLSSCWPDWGKKPDQVTYKFYHSIWYSWYSSTDYTNYFTADLLSCYGVKNTDDPSTGTIYAAVKIICNTGSRLYFFSRLNLDDTFITKHMVYPITPYPAKPFEKLVDMIAGQETILNLEFPDVPSSLLKIGQLDISVTINEFKRYHFIIHQIPYRPESEFIKWH